MRAAPFVFVLVSFVLAGDVSAQSVYSTRGLGVPFAPVDARGQILGGTGVGLLGLNGSLANPAEIVGVRSRGLIAAMQPTNRTIDFGGETDRIGGTRFPVVHMMQPFGQRIAFSAGYGAFLDQSWSAIRDEYEQFGQDSVLARTLFDQGGGISQFRVGAGFALLSNLSVGASAGFYTGHTDVLLRRTFPEQEIPDLQPLESRSTTRYRAPLVSGGFAWDPIPIARLAATVTWSGDLEARIDDDDEPRKLTLPLQLAGGASGLLSPQLLAAVSGRWSGWGAGDGEFIRDDGFTVASADTWDVGGGLEWTGGRLAGRALPIRVGGRYGTLPFHAVGEEQTREWSLGLGLGLQLSSPDIGPLALTDLTIERGGRGDRQASDLSERFWRFTFAVSVFGN